MARSDIRKENHWKDGPADLFSFRQIAADKFSYTQFDQCRQKNSELQLHVSDVIEVCSLMISIGGESIYSIGIYCPLDNTKFPQ